MAYECGIVNCADTRGCLEKISALKDKYSDDELAIIYNYFFEIAPTKELILGILSLIDKLRNPESLAVLIDALVIKDKFASRIKDEESITQIRVNITKALANSKNSKAVNPLLYCLNNKDENYKIKLSCADALGKIGDKYAVMPLVNVLEDDEESSVYVKESAVSALGMIGDEKALDSLVSILETTKGFMSKFTFLKERALEALNKINHKGDPKVMKALRHSLSDESPQVRINAIEVLMNSEEPEAEELIKLMLKDNDREVVKNAVIALYNMLGDDILHDILNSSVSTDFAKIEAEALLIELEEEENEENSDE
ncbi:HEAT repeat domain-containing protein [bacterium]|nr:HEAT repeat domain-containing protein [bacterium]